VARDFPHASYHVHGLWMINKKPTLQVRAFFAWSPFGNQLFWFRELFLQNMKPFTMATKMVATWRVRSKEKIEPKNFLAVRSPAH